MPDSSSTPNLQKLAIEAALSCQWNKALELNQQLIEEEPKNIECLNRMAKAYMELGKYSEAKKIYHQVLEIDPYNTIAQKNIKKIAAVKKSDNGSDKSNLPNGKIVIPPSFFVEEPGLTKTVTLVKVAEPQKLFKLSAGSLVNLVPKNRIVSVTDLNNQYLGVLPDDISFHLLKMIKGGNKYQAFIKSIKLNSVTIMIREVFRSKKFRNQASFLDDAKALTFSSSRVTLFNDDQDEIVEDRIDSEELPV